MEGGHNSSFSDEYFRNWRAFYLSVYVPYLVKRTSPHSSHHGVATESYDERHRQVKVALASEYYYSHNRLVLGNTVEVKVLY